MKALSILVLQASLSCSEARAVPQVVPGEVALRPEIRRALAETWLKRKLEDNSESALRANERVNRLSKQAVALEGEARVILADENASDMEKKLAIWVMQCLPLARYIEFARFVLAETAQARCSESVFWEAVTPSAEWSDAMSRNYRQPDVRAFLSEVKRLRIGGEAGRRRTDDILSGKDAEYLEHLRATGLRPESRCGGREEP